MESELHRHIFEMKELLARVDERTQHILSQAQKTNGRVTTLETEMDGVRTKQENLAVKVTTGASVFAIGVGYLINKFLP